MGLTTKHLRIVFTLLILCFSKLVADAQNLPMVPLLRPAQFNPVIVGYSAAPQRNVPAPSNSLSSFSDAINAQNQQLLHQYNMQPGLPTNAQQVQQLADVERDLKETQFYRDEMERLNKTQYYRAAFNEFNKLNPDSFSLAKAVFTVENAYHDNKFLFTQFTEALKQRATLVKQILKRENLSAKNNLALNYGIQKLYQQPNVFYSAQYKKNITVAPMKYDFDDFEGKDDYTKMFVTKLMVTGKGQCHSMPLMYLLIAEQLGAKANLSLAPQHSFIQFEDANGSLLNFETTNGNLVSNTWLMQSGFITAKAVQNKTYLDTLTQRQLYAQMLCDLLLGYLSKFPYDDFAEKIKQRILQLNPENTSALIVDANIKTQAAMRAIKAAGSPKVKDLPGYPAAYKAYLAMHTAYDKVDNTGYQDMPKEAYQKWLASIEQEKKKEANQALEEQMQREIRQLKNMKSPFHTINPQQ